MERYEEIEEEHYEQMMYAATQQPAEREPEEELANTQAAVAFADTQPADMEEIVGTQHPAEREPEEELPNTQAEEAVPDTQPADMEAPEAEVTGGPRMKNNIGEEMKKDAFVHAIEVVKYWLEVADALAHEVPKVHCAFKFVQVCHEDEELAEQVLQTKRLKQTDAAAGSKEEGAAASAQSGEEKKAENEVAENVAMEAEEGAESAEEEFPESDMEVDMQFHDKMKRMEEIAAFPEAVQGLRKRLQETLEGMEEAELLQWNKELKNAGLRQVRWLQQFGCSHTMLPSVMAVLK